MIIPVVILAIENDDDREFMTKLYIQHGLSMFKMARALTDSRQDAEDVVSDACVSLIRKISLLRELDCNVLEGYIISTVKNTAYALHRKRRAHREEGEEALRFVPDPESEVDKSLLDECSISELMEAIRQLSESDQMIVRMKYFEKRLDREIAQELAVREGALRTRLTRIRQKLNKLLERDDLEE